MPCGEEPREAGWFREQPCARGWQAPLSVTNHAAPGLGRWPLTWTITNQASATSERSSAALRGASYGAPCDGSEEIGRRCEGSGRRHKVVESRHEMGLSSRQARAIEGWEDGSLIASDDSQFRHLSDRHTRQFQQGRHPSSKLCVPDQSHRVHIDDVSIVLEGVRSYHSEPMDSPTVVTIERIKSGLHAQVLTRNTKSVHNGITSTLPLLQANFGSSGTLQLNATCRLSHPGGVFQVKCIDN